MQHVCACTVTRQTITTPVLIVVGSTDLPLILKASEHLSLSLASCSISTQQSVDQRIVAYKRELTLNLYHIPALLDRLRHLP